jgi:oligoendopeptidase F
MKSFKNNIKILSIVMMSIFMLMKCNAPADKTAGADDEAQMSKDRADIPEIYKWNLADMYATQEDWEKAKEDLPVKFDKVAGFKGTLGRSANNLFNALEYMEGVIKELFMFASYASMLSDSDIRESGPLGMDQEANQLYTKFGAAAAFVDPEILSIPEQKLNRFFRDEPKLEKFRQYIDNVYRMKAHTLNASEENLIAEAGIMQGNSGNIYSVFSNAEMPRAEVTLSNGEKVVLDASAYALYRATTNRNDRKLVFDSFFKKLDEFKMTLGTQLYGKVKENMFVKNVRNYNSCLETSLNSNNIPTGVYHKLIENANKNLPTLHRYLELKKRMMGVDELHYYDIYAPLVNDVDLKYSYEEGYDMVKQALAVLGDEYVNTLQEAFDGRWIDVYPNTGKRSGAYSNGSAYDVHPYILLNYNGQYEDVGTLAHELGHTMHSYFSNKHQPFINANYPIFLAEVASTANEALLMDHVLKQIEDPQIKLSILGNYLENARATLFRQTQFAEFELKIHELAEKGESLTGEKFSEIYLDILKKYYGHEDGVMVIDDVYAIEWAYIPHFYYNFYVFQYSTSFTASTMLAEQMLKGGEEMVDKYIDFLSSGNSEYAIPTLKKVGIDMETDEPFEVTMAKMNRVMDDIEAILDEIG